MTGSLRNAFPSEYATWQSMRQRCQNPNTQFYARYGGRGVFVCWTWSSFDQFFKDMGPRPSKRHSLDRVDNDGPYSKLNCRWATWEEQRANQAGVKRYAYQGRSLTLAEICRLVGVRRRAVYQRMHRNGWSLERALGKKEGA
jgi:hypothetical protein